MATNDRGLAMGRYSLLVKPRTKAENFTEDEDNN
jgi:hypothetical protein